MIAIVFMNSSVFGRRTPPVHVARKRAFSIKHNKRGPITACDYAITATPLDWVPVGFR